MRSQFDEQLATLNQELILMGALCEEVITIVSSALVEGDSELAATAAPIDREIDHKERNIESMCLRLLLQQQPVATDLRQISAALKMKHSQFDSLHISVCFIWYNYQKILSYDGFLQKRETMFWLHKKEGICSDFLCRG